MAPSRALVYGLQTSRISWDPSQVHEPSVFVHETDDRVFLRQAKSGIFQVFSFSWQFLFSHLVLSENKVLRLDVQVILSFVIERWLSEMYRLLLR